MYHYKECGLDDVWLVNGYEKRSFPGVGEAVTIHNEQALWSLLGRHIANQERHMVGQELRFLRTLLDWTQDDLGKRMGYTDRQMVGLWEKAIHDPIPLSTETFVRAAYREKIGERASLTQLAEKLMVLERKMAKTKRVIKEITAGQWKLTDAPRELELA